MPSMQKMGVGIMDWQDEVEWCLRLWNSLRVRNEDTPGGMWTLEGIGKYERTGLQAMTLVEIHIDRPTKNEESSLFDHHDYLATLGREIGWEIDAEVRKAHTFEESFSIPEDRIGDVAICSQKCGTVARIEPLAVDQQYYKLNDGICPVCGKKGFAKSWHDLHVVIDDRGAALRSQRQEEE